MRHLFVVVKMSEISEQNIRVSNTVSDRVCHHSQTPVEHLVIWLIAVVVEVVVALTKWDVIVEYWSSR